MPGETVPASACLLPQQKPMLVAELFFGRNIAGRAPVSEAEWDDFVARVVTPNFPDGFTVFDGASGRSGAPQRGAIEREAPKIVLAAAYPRPDLKDRIEAVREAYRTRFTPTLGRPFDPLGMRRVLIHAARLAGAVHAVADEILDHGRIGEGRDIRPIGWAGPPRSS